VVRGFPPRKVFSQGFFLCVTRRPVGDCSRAKGRAFKARLLVHQFVHGSHTTILPCFQHNDMLGRAFFTVWPAVRDNSGWVTGLRSVGSTGGPAPPRSLFASKAAGFASSKQQAPRASAQDWAAGRWRYVAFCPGAEQHHPTLAK